MNPEFSAKTRAGQTAYFSRVPPCHNVQNGYGRHPFVYLGYIRKDEPELWTIYGRWLDTDEAHPHDLMLK